MISDPEICRKVAGACGFEIAAPFYRDPNGRNWRIDSHPTLHNQNRLSFKPDTNWGHAMLAAELFGLFSKHGMVLDDTGVYEPAGHPELCSNYAASSDGLSPRAICDAIIALSH